MAKMNIIILKMKDLTSFAIHFEEHLSLTNIFFFLKTITQKLFPQELLNDMNTVFFDDPNLKLEISTKRNKIRFLKFSPKKLLVDVSKQRC